MPKLYVDILFMIISAVISKRRFTKDRTRETAEIEPNVLVDHIIFLCDNLNEISTAVLLHG